MSQHTPEGERLSSYLLDTTLARCLASCRMHAGTRYAGVSGREDGESNPRNDRPWRQNMEPKPAAVRSGLPNHRRRCRSNIWPPNRGAETGGCSAGLPKPRPPLSLEIVPDNPKDTVFFNLGPRPPRLWPEDVELARSEEHTSELQSPMYL